MDRASTFSDPAIIRRLQSEFIPVASDTHDLQHRKTPAGEWFGRFVQQVKSTELRRQLKQGETWQGLYIFAADGTTYGWRNSRQPRYIEKFMDEARAAFRASPPTHAEIAANVTQAAFTKSPAETTSVIRVFTRIRPLPDGCDAKNALLGRDHLWILEREAREIARHGEPVGESFELPATLVARLVRFHLVDDVRGEPDLWEPKHVQHASFRAELLRERGTTRSYRLSGDFEMSAEQPRRSVKGTLAGEFDMNERTARVTRFRAYGEAMARGHSTYTPGEPSGRFPLVFAMVEVNDPVSRIVPPQGVSWGDREYEDARLGK